MNASLKLIQKNKKNHCFRPSACPGLLHLYPGALPQVVLFQAFSLYSLKLLNSEKLKIEPKMNVTKASGNG